jgi:hypothetical protein
LRYLPAFLINALRSAQQAKAASGNLAVSVLSDARFIFWTRTVWNDEQSMRAFMIAGTHRSVMPRLLQWCDEASVAHWLQEPLEPPSWQEVHRCLQKEGRRSKVNNPSDAQLRLEILPPKNDTRIKVQVMASRFALGCGQQRRRHAKTPGLTVPPAVLARVDDVIE